MLRLSRCRGLKMIEDQEVARLERTLAAYTERLSSAERRTTFAVLIAVIALILAGGALVVVGWYELYLSGCLPNLMVTSPGESTPQSRVSHRLAVSHVRPIEARNGRSSSGRTAG